MTPFMEAAREILGNKRFEEVGGALWLVRRQIWANVRRKVPLRTALERWEQEFRRCVEEGRYREGRNGRKRRVARLSEIEHTIDDHVRRQF
jgi:hypothetical protein